MSFAALLDQRAELAHPGEAPDADGVVRGNPAPPYAADVPIRVARPSDRTAFRDDAGRVLVDYVGFLLPDPATTGAMQPEDYVTVGGTVYRVAGAPLELRARGAVHHVEVPLRREERT